MKKVLLFITMAAALLFTQCRKEESVSSAGKTVSMTVTAGPGSKTDITSTGAITWSTGDKLYVGDGDKYVGCLTLVGEGGSATGVFSGNVTLTGITEGTEKEFGFFYLGSADYTVGDGALEKGESTSVEVKFDSQTGLRENLGSCHVGYGTAEGTVTDGVVTDINVMLVSHVALARFSFTKDDAAYTSGLTLKGDNIYNEMTVNFDGTFTGKDGSTTDGISLTGSHSERYVMLVPTDETTGEQKLTFTSTDNKVSGTATLDNILPNRFYGKDEAIAVTLKAVPVESVSLPTSLSLEEGKTETLTATVLPENATNKDVTWSSDDESVATVSGGVVTAVGAGSATITVTTVDGGKTATCAVTVTAAPYVDLGLSSGLLWAKCNLGASKPEDYGRHFMWGSTTSGGDSYCKWETCPGNGSNFSYNESAFNTWKSSHLTDGVLNPDVDAAAELWGGAWRMPTIAEWEELHNGTTSAWTGDYNNTGVAGQVFTSKTNGKVLFLPAAGYCDGTSLYNAGSGGSYWSSSLDSSNPSRAYYMYFSSGFVSSQFSYDRYNGFSVRPVQ